MDVPFSLSMQTFFVFSAFPTLETVFNPVYVPNVTPFAMILRCTAYPVSSPASNLADHMACLCFPLPV